jgi:hypothetical protein
MDMPQIDSDSPGGVGVGRQRNDLASSPRSAFSAASTLCNVSKVSISLAISSCVWFLSTRIGRPYCHLEKVRAVLNVGAKAVGGRKHAPTLDF